MAHRYLEELNNPDVYPYSLVNLDDERQEHWKHQQEEFGFDDSETWCLYHSFYAWLYERLRMYVDVCDDVIDLNFHKFDFKGKEYTQLELINMILERLKYYFSDDYDDFNVEDARYIHEIGEIWAIILFAMWWQENYYGI